MHHAAKASAMCQEPAAWRLPRKMGRAAKSIDQHCKMSGLYRQKVQVGWLAEAWCHYPRRYSMLSDRLHCRKNRAACWYSHRAVCLFPQSRVLLPMMEGPVHQTPKGVGTVAAKWIADYLVSPCAATALRCGATYRQTTRKSAGSTMLHQVKCGRARHCRDRDSRR